MGWKIEPVCLTPVRSFCYYKAGNPIKIHQEAAYCDWRQKRDNSGGHSQGQDQRGVQVPELLRKKHGSFGGQEFQVPQVRVRMAPFLAHAHPAPHKRARLGDQPPISRRGHSEAGERGKVKMALSRKIAYINLTDGTIETKPSR